MLYQENLFGTIDKVKEATDLIKQYEPPEGYYVCFSGGKDSVVALDLVKRAGVKFEAWHSITTVEPPELMRMIRDFYPEVQHHHPKLTMSQLIQKKGIPPLRIARYCCSMIKEIHGQNRLKVTGIRAEESPRRAKRKTFELDNRNKKGAFLHPVHDWKIEDIWEYIHKYNVPYCKLYDEGFTRIGCVLCPFQGYETTTREMERFPAITEYYRRACRKSFELNRDKLTANFKDGDDMFNWWINSRRQTRIAEDCKQIPLFSEDDGSIL